MLIPATSKITVEIKLVYPQEAAHLRLTCHFERQRAIDEINKKRLAGEMDAGRFIIGTPLYFAVLPDRSMLLLNGNHTLEAIVLSGKPQVLVFIFCQVADVAEASRIYATFDIHKTRSWLDSLKAVGADKEIMMPTKSMPAVGLIMHGFVPSRYNTEAANSREARFVAMNHYKEAAKLFHAAIAGAPTPHRLVITRSGCMAVALETLRYQPAKAVEFWEAVAHDDGLAKDDPRKTLLRFLMSTKTEGARSGVLLSRGSMQAWNAWYRGDSLSVIQPSRLTSIQISGTPWGSTQIKPVKPLATRRRARKPAEEEAHEECDLTDIFETGVRVTETSSEPVVLYKAGKRA